VVSGRRTGEPAANSNDKAQLTMHPAEPSYRTPNVEPSQHIYMLARALENF